MCASTNERMKQPIKEATTPASWFFGFWSSARPTSFLQDFLKTTPYQRAPRKHCAAAAQTTRVRKWGVIGAMNNIATKFTRGIS
jgi:hypothetical protein